MALEVKPGGKVSIEVIKTPRCEAAAKTLSRIFGKDLAGRNLRRHRKALRASAKMVHRRGGRPWEHAPRAPRLIRPEKAATCTVLVTPELVGDLKSVQRFIKVSAAK
jgi:hypothetical protein